MLEWLHDNTAFVSMLTGIVTALIWLVYLQVIVTSSSRQRRAVITINRGSGKDLDAQLVLCNLGYETVYVTDVIAEVDVEGESFAANITDCEDTMTEVPAGAMAGTLQGPLGNGDCRGLGTIRSIFERIEATTSFGEEADANGLSIVVLAGREASIGVRRRYRLIHDAERTYLDADMMDTKRISRRAARRYRASWGFDVPKGYVGAGRAQRSADATASAA